MKNFKKDLDGKKTRRTFVETKTNRYEQSRNIFRNKRLNNEYITSTFKAKR